MKITLVFDTDISGHHIEYLNHLYLRAGEKREEQFIFVVSEELFVFKDYLKWPQFDNVFFRPLSEIQINKLRGSFLISSYKRSSLLRKLIRENNASHVFLIALMPFLPFLPFLVDKKVKVSGIIYNISSRRYKTDNCIKRFQDYVKYSLLSGSVIFHRIFLLNDTASSRLFNRRFRTDHFRYLPDPVMTSRETALTDSTLKFSSSQIVFLHFGSLAIRKGTLDILNSIELLDNSVLEKAVFIFAGYVNDDIKPFFYELTAKLKSRAQIKVYEGFCSYELLSDLCSSAHYLLLPYKQSCQSSGLLGYAARFNIPVIGSSDGLLGSLIKSYGLGFTYDLKDIILAEILKKHVYIPYSKIDGSVYLKQNSVRNFQETIFE